jgi:hypothetical protein
VFTNPSRLIRFTSAIDGEANNGQPSRVRKSERLAGASHRLLSASATARRPASRAVQALTPQDVMPKWC